MGSCILETGIINRTLMATLYADGNLIVPVAEDVPLTETLDGDYVFPNPLEISGIETPLSGLHRVRVSMDGNFVSGGWVLLDPDKDVFATGEPPQSSTVMYPDNFSLLDIDDLGRVTALLQIEPGVPVPPIPPASEDLVMYCAVQDVYRQFGKFNVDVWADVEGDKDPAKILETIESSILDASRLVDDMLRDGVCPVPFPYDDVPRIVNYIVRLRAGWQLYCSRGMYVKDWEKAFDKILCEFERIAGKLHDGHYKLANSDDEYQAGTSPGVRSDG